jgi:hypothetical protein
MRHTWRHGDERGTSVLLLHPRRVPGRVRPPGRPTCRRGSAAEAGSGGPRRVPDGDAQEGGPDAGGGRGGDGRISAIENGSVAELATLADYIRALDGELKVIADFGDSWRRVA